MRLTYAIPVVFFLSVLVLSLFLEPAFGQENATEELKGFDWVGLISTIVEFVADMFVKAAEIMRKGVENLQSS